MIEYRIARPQELDACTRFGDMVFQDHGVDISFREALPKVYGPQADGARYQHIAVDEEGQIRGLVAVLPQELVTPFGSLKLGYVGTVSTHPQHRGEGHMKALMAHALGTMQTDGTDIAVLGGQRQRYAYYGYAQGGERYTYSINKSNIRHALKAVDISGVSLKPIHSGTAYEAAAARFHNARPIRVERDWAGFVKVCRSYHGMPWLFLKDGQPAGFVVFDKFGNSISDICVQSPEDMDLLLKAGMALADVNSFRVKLAPYESALNARLCQWAESTMYGADLCVRILHYRKTVETLLRLKSAYTRLADGELSLNCEGERFTICVINGQVSVTEGGNAPEMDALTAARCLTDPFDRSARPDAPEGWFPLPLYVAEPDAF